MCLCVCVSRGVSIDDWICCWCTTSRGKHANVCAHRHITSSVSIHFHPLQKHLSHVIFSSSWFVCLFWHCAPFTFILLHFFSHHLYIFCFCTFCFKGDSVRAGFNIEMKTAGKVAPLRVCMCLYTQLQIEGFLLHCSPASGWNWLVTICYFSSIRLSRHLSQLQSPHPWCSYISIYWQLMKSVFVSL